jgi:hypothetical protein
VPTDTKIAAADDEWVTIAQIAKRLNMCHKGVRNKIAEGRLSAGARSKRDCGGGPARPSPARRGSSN